MTGLRRRGREPGLVAKAYSPSNLETEAGELLHGEYQNKRSYLERPYVKQTRKKGRERGGDTKMYKGGLRNKHIENLLEGQSQRNGPGGLHVRHELGSTIRAHSKSPA